MILLREQRTIILTPGKCGSTSLHEVFPERIIGPQGPWRRVGHCDYPDAVGKHTMIVPYEFLGFRKVIVVRPEEDYLRSLWRQHCRRGGGLNFVEFLEFRKLWAAECTVENWFYWRDLGDYLAESPAEAERIDLACLGEFVRALTGVELPRLNASA